MVHSARFFVVHVKMFQVVFLSCFIAAVLGAPFREGEERRVRIGKVMNIIILVYIYVRFIVVPMHALNLRLVIKYEYTLSCLFNLKFSLCVVHILFTAVLNDGAHFEDDMNVTTLNGTTILLCFRNVSVLDNVPVSFFVECLQYCVHHN